MNNSEDSRGRPKSGKNSETRTKQNEDENKIKKLKQLHYVGTRELVNKIGETWKKSRLVSVFGSRESKITFFESESASEESGEEEKNVKKSSKPGSGKKSDVKQNNSKGNVKPPKLSVSGHVDSPVAKKALGLNVPKRGSPFETGPNIECIQLLRQLGNVHEEALDFIFCLRAVLGEFRQELRAQYVDSIGGGCGSSTTKLSADKSEIKIRSDKGPFWVTLQPFIDGLKSICEIIGEIERQYSNIVVFQSQCKLVLYSKLREAKRKVAHDHLTILHGVNQLILASVQLLSSPSHWESDEADEEKYVISFWQDVFQLSEVYNECLETAWSLESPPIKEEIALANKIQAPQSPLPTPAQLSSTSKKVNQPSEISGKKVSSDEMRKRVKILVQVNAANRNDSPLLRLSLKPFPSTRILQILSHKRASFAALKFTRAVQQGISRSRRPPGQKFAVNTFDSHSTEQFEICFGVEDSHLAPLAQALSHCPNILGKGAVKIAENGDQRLTKSARTKLYNYFHEFLWSLVGEISEDLLLWGISPAHIPLVLEPVDDFVNMKSSISLTKHTQGSILSPLWSALESICGSFHSFSLLANWDEKMQDGLEIASKVKRPEHVHLPADGKKLSPSDWATEIGSKFGEIVATSLTLIDTASNVPGGFRRHSMSNEEEPLTDEAQVLFRLEATLAYLKAWIVKRTKVWLNAWAIPQFLACSQRDSALVVQLIRSHKSVLITRDILLNSDNFSIKLRAMYRQMCADDLSESIQKLQLTPDELLMAVGPVCRTLSLATLQSSMPAAPHWRGTGQNSGSGSDRPSPYVKTFINRILEPVTTSSVELLPGPVQESMGKQAIIAACDAWLQFILQKKIRFSEWGAVQLLRDFLSLRDWIRNDTELESEARKAILQLEVLKKCEGVAYLLLRSPGDVLGVGKPDNTENTDKDRDRKKKKRDRQSNNRSRKVAPSNSGSSISSPENSSTPEDDIPPEMYVPNQQKWLELRLRRGILSSPCCP